MSGRPGASAKLKDICRAETYRSDDWIEVFKVGINIETAVLYKAREDKIEALSWRAKDISLICLFGCKISIPSPTGSNE